MKQVRFLTTAFSIISLALSLWALQQVLSKDSDVVQASLNLVYFVSLLIAFVGFRISLNYSMEKSLIIGLTPLGIVVLSTYTWMNPAELLNYGKYTLALIPFFCASTLALMIKQDGSILSRVMQFAVMIPPTFIAYCAYIGIDKADFYTYCFIGLILTTAATMSYLIFSKTTN